VRRVSDLANREELESKLADDPLVSEEAAQKLVYVPTVTREEFETSGRIGTLIENGRLFRDLEGEHKLDPATDRVMMCGSMDMIRDLSATLEGMGFTEGSNAKPGDYVIERAFVG